MERRKFSKTIVFSLVWATFLSLLISNWGDLESAQWRNIWETLVNVIGDSLLQNAGFIFLFSFVILVITISYRHNRKAQIGETLSKKEEWQKNDSVDIFMQDVDMDCDPAYSHLISNIHHNEYLRNHWEWKS